jgi:hypothetical protein
MTDTTLFENSSSIIGNQNTIALKNVTVEHQTIFFDVSRSNVDIDVLRLD